MAVDLVAQVLRPLIGKMVAIALNDTEAPLYGGVLLEVITTSNIYVPQSGYGCPPSGPQVICYFEANRRVAYGKLNVEFNVHYSNSPKRYFATLDYSVGSSARSYTFNGQTLTQIVNDGVDRPKQNSQEDSRRALQTFRKVVLNSSPDCFFVTDDGQKVAVHSFVLVAHSPVFAAMFNTDMQEKTSGEVKIKEYSYQGVFLLLGKFAMVLYARETQLTGEDVLQLISLFDAYQIPNSLDLIGLGRLDGLLAVDNAAEMLFTAAHHGQNGLLPVITKFIKKTRDAVTNTDAWITLAKLPTNAGLAAVLQAL